MMLLGRGWVAAGLGIGLVLSAGGALGQSSKHRGHVVQPKDGPPPEQAVQADPPAQYEHASDPEPPPEPEPEPPAETQIAPSQPAVEQAAQPDPAPEPTLPQTAPAPPPAVVEAASPPVVPARNGVQNQLQKDTAALLQLAQDLKAELEKAGSNTMSLVAIRKAEEIQKLTKNLRERMKDQEQVPVTK